MNARIIIESRSQADRDAAVTYFNQGYTKVKLGRYTATTGDYDQTMRLDLGYTLGLREVKTVPKTIGLGPVGVGFQPDPSCRQVQKTQELMRVFVIASGHAPPPLEPADAPFHGVARLVLFQGVGLGVRAPLPGRNDGLGTPLRQSRAEGVAVISTLCFEAS